MGKGIIKSGGADGFYNVELTFERESLDKMIASIDVYIESLTSVIDVTGEGTEKELLKLERNSYIKKKEYLQNNMPEDPTVSAWCADLTEDISGNVGTIEVPGERGVVQIQPGHEGNSTYNATRDGQLQPSIASTPSATFYNLAMLPGWQKWKPTYRYGVISNIDTEINTCNVKLDEVESSQQNLDINQELNLTGISVSYMSCDSVAFEDGDNVLVKFEGQTWAGAQVVGFRDNPKACVFQIKIERGDGALITEISGLLTYFKVYNSSDIELSITTPTYNIETEYWSFGLTNPEDIDIDGYWIDYLCEDGIETQYPYRYKSTEKDEVIDLIQIGKYDDIIPYWVQTPYENITPLEQSYSCNNIISLGDDGIMETPAPQQRIYMGGDVIYHHGVTIKSSIPYKVTYKANRHIVNSHYYGIYANKNSYPYFLVSPGAVYDPRGYDYCGYINNAANSARLLLTYPDSSQSYLSVYEPNPDDRIDEYYGYIEGVNHFFIIEDESIRNGWLPATGDPENPTLGPELTYLCSSFLKGGIYTVIDNDY